jgi:hypothetical protein
MDGLQQGCQERRREQGGSSAPKIDGLKAFFGQIVVPPLDFLYHCSHHRFLVGAIGTEMEVAVVASLFAKRDV